MPKIRITDYKGSVIAGWKTPKTKRQAGYAFVRLIRFYRRCKEHNLLTKDIVSAIKRFTEAILKYTSALGWMIADPEIMSSLNEIKQLKIEELEEELVAEKMRTHTDAVCSMCKTRLVYPAYVVYRKGLTIVKKSNPIGIRCLYSISDKLNNLAQEMTIEDEKNISAYSPSSTKVVSLSLF